MFQIALSSGSKINRDMAKGALGTILSTLFAHAELAKDSENDKDKDAESEPKEKESGDKGKDKEKGAETESESDGEDEAMRDCEAIFKLLCHLSAQDLPSEYYSPPYSDAFFFPPSLLPYTTPLSPLCCVLIVTAQCGAAGRAGAALKAVGAGAAGDDA